ncbi:MAG TPA: hypothetical protein VH643_09410 [Gemmataceae bacterium]|jgi:hypothetical protein
MSRKTESLSFPTNPLAAIRELQELDSLPATTATPERGETRDLATPLPDNHTTGSEVSSTTTLADRSPVSSEVVKLTSPKRVRRETPVTQDPADPMRAAVKELLSRPYSTERKAPLTVSSVKMPTEVWERLGWAAKLSGQNQQDIIADALKDYFQKMLRQL